MRVLADGRRSYGSIGATASWALGLLACVGVILSLYMSRRRRAKFNFPQRPMWRKSRSRPSAAS